MASRPGIPPSSSGSSARPPDRGVALLLALLDEAFDRKAWHGTTLRGALRGLDAEGAAWRPAPGRHNVWEVAVHAAYWKYSVRRQLTREKRGSFPLVGSNWFPRQGGSDRDWQADLRLLDTEHRRLREVVAGLSDADLGAPLANGQPSARIVRGAAAHDLYHAGQIQLLKRLRGAER